MTGEAPAAYEEKSVPSSGRGPSITRSSAVLPRCEDSPIAASSPAAVLPRHDKVVTLLDKIRNTRHGNRLNVSAALGTNLGGNKPDHHTGRWRGRKLIGECMRRRVLDPRVAVLRHFAAAGLALLIGSAGAFAQSGTPSPQDQSASRRPPMPPTPPRTTSARPTNSSRRPRPSTARPETPNASGSAAAWFA